MTDEALDPVTHDTLYVNYDEQVVSGIDQVVQNVKIRLLMIMGELFDDARAGMDYLGSLYGSKDPNVIDALIKSTIKSTPEVVDIVSYTSTANRSTRQLTVDFKISTIYGSTAVSGLELLQ